MSEGGASAAAGAGAPAVRRLHVEVPRTARCFTLGDPEAGDVWVALHGYGQLAEYFVRHLAPIAAGRLVVAPEALSRFYLESRSSDGEPDAPVHGPRVGATWMTREDRLAEIGDYVRYLDLALAAAAPQVEAGAASLVVLGFSQGATTAARWLAARDRAGRPPAARLVAWAGELPADVDFAAGWLQRTRLTLVAADDDPYATPAVVAQVCGRLDAAGVRYDTATFTGGHRLDAATLRRVAGG